MGRRRKKLEPKPCERCGQDANKLTRIQHDADGAWVMVCDECWPELSEDNPHYTYGGVWKARKRR